MTTNENTAPSAEAFERVRRDLETAEREKAEIESKLGDATAALGDLARRDTLVEHFRGKDGVNDPYAAAANAIADVTVKGAADDGLAEAADAWHTRMSSAFGTPTAATGTPTTEAPTPPPAPLAQPNPTAPGGTITTGGPMRVGTPEYDEWAKGRSIGERRQAAKDGKVQFSQENQAAMGTINP